MEEKVEKKEEEKKIKKDKKSSLMILKEENETLKKEVDHLKNQVALAYADTENMKKRILNEEAQAKKYRIQSFALEILPVLDNLERALSQEVNEESKAYHTGLKMIYDQLLKALENEGVQEIEALDKPFDANLHQAILTEKKEGIEKGIVIQVLQKGYLLKDRILRAAMVKVSE